MCLDQNCLKNKQEFSLKICFWTLMAAFLAIWSYFMIHNAWWIISDEAIVVKHVGMGNAFSPLGFPEMVPEGRLYPLAYSLYNVLLLFNSGYNSPTTIYILHSIALSIYAIFFALIGLRILREKQAVFRYTATLLMVIIAVCRVYPEFVMCQTGVWIIQLFIPIFIYSLLRFEETENWEWGVLALIIINYISYCYENIIIIPFAIGACSLLFNWKQLSRNKKLFNILLIAGCVLFFGIYLIAILPHATNFYEHDTKDSLLVNGIKIFIAQKIYWLAIIACVVRAWQICKNKSAYTIYDTLLLTSLAYFVGTALLKLNFTYYYNVGALIALIPILYYGSQLKSMRWICLIFAVLAMFYGRKMPNIIKENQELRMSSKSQILDLSKEADITTIYWFAPVCDTSSAYAEMERASQRARLNIIINWVKRSDEQYLVEQTEFDESKEGIWLFPGENQILFPDLLAPDEVGTKIFDSRNISGYRI